MSGLATERGLSTRCLRVPPRANIAQTERVDGNIGALMNTFLILMELNLIHPFAGLAILPAGGRL